MSEGDARIRIDKLLIKSGWVLSGYGENVNVKTEVKNKSGVADYVLYDSSDFPLCVIEAKKEDKVDLLSAKEQARGYAISLKCRFIILSNGNEHHFWNLDDGSPTPITTFPTQENLMLRRESKSNPSRDESEEINIDYIALTQFPNFAQHPDYINEEKRDQFIKTNKLRLLRDYQLKALKAVQNDIAKGKDRFLLEMATGTGKTLTASAIIKMFLRLYSVKRVLFLVDRIELERQAKQEFDEVLGNDFLTVIWKENQSDWTKAEIVVSTVQSFVSRNKYQKVFRKDHFDLVISDEAHRSLGARSREVFEHFNGFKLGLTATPKDYLKSVDIEDLSQTDPRSLEKRLMLDTYTTFGCNQSEPTFRYSLEDGVKDGYLVNPKVIDARTEITTELLSEQGYVFEGVDKDGNDYEETFTRKDFEKKFFSHNTNTVLCTTFLKNAMPDPYTGEIGKTLIFCVSQNHAAKVTQILNTLADEVSPQKYSSDFAVQVTSNVQDAQQMTVNFRNNSLSGHSKFNAYYRTSKTRVCVTVGMMTTGYDCTDILNICMVRPVFSPSEFIQMKGRGTRKYDFSQSWMSQSDIPDDIESEKPQFKLFDFFGNYEYFENEFDYDEILKLPIGSSELTDDATDPPNIDGAISTIPDPLAELKEIIISDDGMKIDREFYRSFRQQVHEDATIKALVLQQNFDEAGIYLKKHILDKPENSFTMDKIGKSLGVDRKLGMTELLQYVFGQIDHIPSQKECLDEETDKLDKVFNLTDDTYRSAKEVFEAYAVDDNFRNIIDNKQYAQLRTHPSGNSFLELPEELRESIPTYIKENVNLEKLKNAR